MRTRTIARTLGWSVAAAGVSFSVMAGDLAFSDPASLPPPPTGAVGYPSRAADLDALPAFVNPPPGYGEVAFYWWLGDPLTKERLAWQLDRLSGLGISGLQINYCHSDRGARPWGLTYPSEPPLFSDEWWKLVQWFAGEAQKRGMAISLSDYTLGIVGHGWWMDEILKEHPDMRGSVLDSTTKKAQGTNEFNWEVPAGTVSVTAFRVEDKSLASGSAIDLRSRLRGRALRWQPPAGAWQVMAVHSRVSTNSVNPLDPRLGPEVIRRFFQQFEDHLPGEAGKALNFFFSDELSFGIHGNLWHKDFAGEFRKRKGYDLVPELPALFTDIGPRTPKVRLDYFDVMVALEEEAYFRPLFEWHYRRGMIYGCDHGGRGGNVTEFGDYFRTQRWMLGPGNDQPRLGHAVGRTKVQSSISHLYQRPRTWLEGYYGSGWGTTPEQLTQASAENYALGSTLQVLHGLYYSTHGGWWEWAPPCNHFRMPYWEHMAVWMKWSQRLCYLMSQGVHRCDVALVYPVAPSQAGLDGAASVKTAFALGEHLFNHSMDFDFMDEESLARARVAGKDLRVSGETYRVLVLPAMKAVHYSTLLKAAEFKRAGGIVVALGALPEASDRVGRDDPELATLVREVLPAPLVSAEQVERLVGDAFPRDFSGPGRVNHRRVGPREVYLVCGAPKDAECVFRADGKVELWDPWTGSVKPLPVLGRTTQGTRLRMPLGEAEAQLLVFSPGEGVPVAEAVPPRVVDLEGEWEFELKPVLDNRWGDFRWPPTSTLIGAEARQFRYADETAPTPGWQDPNFDDSHWPKVTAAFGPKFWKLGPLPEQADATELEAGLVALKQVDPSVPVVFGGHRLSWQPVAFSWRWGVEDDAGHEGYHGLKEEVSDDFIPLGKLKFNPTSSTYEKEPGGSRYYLWTAVSSPSNQTARLLAGGNKPAALWLDHARLDPATGTAEVHAGSNPFLLRYDQVGRGHIVLAAGQVNIPPANPGALAARWYGRPEILPYDTRPQTGQPAGWYRFTAPPCLRAMTVTAQHKVRAWANGEELEVAKGDAAGQWRVAVSKPSARSVPVALRLEQPRGEYGGAALPEPIALDCGPGLVAPGDWSRNDGLTSYSGGAWYRKNLTLSADESAGEVTLDLGQVMASAEVRVNGQPAGIRVATPWRFDLTHRVKPGPNRLEVLVYNALANHYTTIPTRYRGSTVSGMLGPVRIETRGVQTQ